MVASIQYILFSLIILTSKVSTQHFSPMISCYINYQSEETRSKTTNHLMHYSYHQAEISVHSTLEKESCATVGCVCFSYKASCSHPSAGPNHHSKCKDIDRQTGKIKWHYGWTSQAKCEEMRREPERYRDLTCCQTDRCNNQPGTVVETVDPDTAPQHHDPNEKPGESYTGFARGPNDVQVLDNLRPIQPNQNQNHMDYQTAPQPNNDGYYAPQRGDDAHYASQPNNDAHYAPQPNNDAHYAPQPNNDAHYAPQQYHRYSPASVASNYPETPKPSHSYDDRVTHSTTSHMGNKQKSSRFPSNRVHHSNITSTPINTNTPTTIQPRHGDEKSTSRANLTAASSFASFIMLFTLSFCFRFII